MIARDGSACIGCLTPLTPGQMTPLRVGRMHYPCRKRHLPICALSWYTCPRPASPSGQKRLTRPARRPVQFSLRRTRLKMLTFHALYVALLFVAAVIGVALAAHAWQHRATPGAKAFAGIVLGMSLWSLALAIMAFTNSTEAADFWGRWVRFIANTTMPVVILVLAGTLVPLAANVPDTFFAEGPRPSFTPFGFAAKGLIYACALFRYRLIDIVPIARDRVIESTDDAVPVLDVQRRLVDVNPAAQALLSRKDSELVGQPIADLLLAWSELVERQDSRLHAEMITGEGEGAPQLARVLRALVRESRFLDIVTAAEGSKDGR